MRAWLMSLAFVCGLLACSGERSSDNNRNLGTGDDDGGTVEGGEQNADASLDDAAEAPSDAELDAGALDGDLPSDAATDASDDAGVHTFSITVRRGLVPMPGARVFFHDASGALTGDYTTGDDGRVSSVSAPSMVTVLPVPSGDPSSALLFTYTAVAANDQLILELPPDTAEGDELPAYALSAPGHDSIVDVQVLAGRNGCAYLEFALATEGPHTLNWPSLCPRAASNSILAVGYQGNDDLGGFSFAKRVPAFGAEPSEVQLGPWAEPAPVQLTINNLPSDSYVIAGLGAWSEGARFGLSDWQGELSAGSTTRSTTFPTPPGFADELDVLVNTSGPALGQHRTVAIRQAPAAQLTVDFAARVAGATAGSHGGTVARASFSWETEPASSTQADASMLTLNWTIPGGEVSTRQSWLLLGPGDVTTMTAPELPATLTAFLPGGPRDATVSHFASSLLDGYRPFVAQPVRPVASLDNPGGHPLSVELPTAGSLHAVTWVERQPQ